MTPYPYRVICEGHTDTALSYLSEWYATRKAAEEALTRHTLAGWCQVSLVTAGPIPNATRTGKPVLAYSARRPQRKKGA